MRTVGTIPHPQMMITIFLWNNKYLVKFEAGPYEQVYKIDETGVEDEQALISMITEEFTGKVAERFRQMHADFGKAISG